MTRRNFEIDAKSSPNLPGMMLITIRALNDLGGSAINKELDEKVIELEGVTDDEQLLVMPDGSRPRLNYYLAWARTYLKKGGALVNSTRGVWALTETGATIKEIDEVQAIYSSVNKERRQQIPTKGPDLEEGKPDAIDPEGTEDWKTSLLTLLGTIRADAFERLSQRLLREAGFVKVEVLGKSGDGGIDGVGLLRVNLISFQIYFQCKRWKGSVGAKEIRDFRGALQGRAEKGLFITTGNFTRQATDEASRDGAIAIDLIDGDRLCDLIKENGLGVDVGMVERVQVQSAWFDFI
ncbi:restriction endonuclease [Candidatus Poribacteria bacterium]|nr:restriction endonuclease [Candidatus Poribacteria bacterium]